MEWMGPEKEFGRVRMIEVAGRDGWRRVEGAAYHSTGHSAAYCCTINAEKTGMRVQHHAIYTSLSMCRAPSTLYPTD